MMKKKYIIILVIFLLMLSILIYFKEAIYFGWKLDQVENKLIASDKIVKEITLINIGQGDREYIAHLLNSLSQCYPETIVLDAFFLKRKEKETDRLLMEAIDNNSVVLSIKGGNHGGFFPSDPYFSKGATDSGLAQLSSQYGLALSYFPLKQMNSVEKPILSHISVAAASQYDSARTQKFMQKVKVDQKYLIEYSAIQNNFIVYNYEDFNFNCDELKDRIVILGYLGPGKEDRHKTPLGLEGIPVRYNRHKGDMYGAVIIANQILMILNESELIEY